MAVTDAFRSLRVPGLFDRWSLNDLLERWRDALLVCLPTALRRTLAHRDQRLVVVPDGAGATFYHQQGDERRAIGDLDVGDAGSLQTLLAGIRRGHRRPLIELPADGVLTRIVSFPAQVRNNLAQVIRYEIDRISPFQVDQVCFDFRIRDGAAPRDKLQVELVLCRRDRVQAWLQRLNEAGSPIEQVTWEGAWHRANLLSPQERPRRRGSVLGVTRLMLLGVLVLAVAVLMTPLWQKNRQLGELSAELAEARARGEEVHEVRGALERAREGSVAVLQRKLVQPRMIDLLRELTETLPDDTWVQNLDVRDGEVQIRGESAQATALIGLLEKAPGISDVAFRSPVVQVAATGQERFHISFKYTREEPQ